MANVTELKEGNYIKEDGNIYLLLKKDLNKTAMAKMNVILKIKNMRTGSVTEITRKSGYDIEALYMEKKKMSYLYEDSNFYVFMDNDTCEQIEVEKNRLEKESKFLTSGLEVEILSYEGEIFGIILPAKVTLQIVSCEPAVRGDTVNKATKEATLETGLKVRVPLFIESGESIIVRTDNGAFDGRAN